MYCINCGSKLIENAKFCANCGAKAIPADAEVKKEDLAEEKTVFEEASAEAAAVVEIKEPEVKEEIPEEEEIVAVEEAAVVEEIVAVEEAAVVEEIIAVEEAPAVEEVLAVEEAPVIEEAPAVEETFTSERTAVYDRTEKVSSDTQIYTPPADTRTTVRIDPRYKPLGVWSYIGMWILMLIPVVNLILVLVWAFSSKTNFNRKNLAVAIIIIELLTILFTIAVIILGMQFGYTLLEQYVFPAMPEIEDILYYIGEAFH